MHTPFCQELEIPEHRLATLLADLLANEEDAHYYNSFDIGLLTKRLAGATERAFR